MNLHIAAAICFLAISLGACTADDRADRASQFSDLLGSSEEGLVLRLHPKRQSIEADGPWRIAYLFQNRGSRREIQIGPNLMELEVVGPDGGQVLPVTHPAFDEVVLPIQAVQLLRYEFVGGVLDLTCLHPTHVLDQRSCLGHFRFPTPGEYRVILHYASLSDPEILRPRPNVDYVSLVSDTAVLVLR